MKRQLIAMGMSLLLLTGGASATKLPQLRLNGVESEGISHVEQGVSYVSLRSVTESLDNQATVRWEKGGAVVRSEGLDLTAVPGEQWIISNGRYLYIPGGVQLRDGKTLVPIRVLAQALGVEVRWEEAGNVIHVEGTPSPDTADYEEDAVYWLSRIISSESRGEPLQGQIAVGNVVLNRVKSPDFPDTIYGVIFDDRWGGQFEPARNGTVYQEPVPQSVAVAKMCLEGASTAGESLYFLDPIKAGNLWTVHNRPYLMTIGVHDFYG